MADKGDEKKDKKSGESDPTEKRTLGKSTPKPPSPTPSSSREEPQPSTSTSSSWSDIGTASQSKKPKLTESTTVPGKKTSLVPAQYKIPKRIGAASHTSRYCLKTNVQIEVNYLRLTYKSWDQQLYHYDVSIKPDKQKNLWRRALHIMQQRHYRDRHPAFDGSKNLYAARSPLPFGPHNVLEDAVDVVDPDANQRTTNFVVTIKLVSEQLNVKQLVEYTRRGSSQNAPQDVLQATDVALRARLFDLFIPCGRSFFTGPLNVGRQNADLGGGFELYSGFFQSAVVAKECFLNVDVSNKGFPTERSIVNHLTHIMRINLETLNSGLQDWMKRGLENFLKGLKVVYALQGARRVYKVNALGPDAIRHRFPLADQGEISVAEYFGRIKNVQLRYPKLPLLHVGAPSKNTMVPLEFCTILKDQVVMRKLDDRQTSNMVQAAVSSTDRRRERINNCVRDARYDRSDTLTREFGITIDTRMVKVDSHIFKPPQIVYRQGSVIPRDGSWRMDNNAFRSTSANGIHSWVVLNKDPSSTYDDAIRNKLVRPLTDAARRAGLNLASPRTVYRGEQSNTEDSVLRELQYLNQRYGPLQIVVVIMPNERLGTSQVYGNIKRASELKCGVLTQCIKGMTVNQKMNNITAQNLLLKMNTKVNGVNHELGGPLNPTVLKTPIMFVGADVTHPAPGSTNSPSIAAVAASFDPVGFRYKMMYHLQGSRREMIDDFEEIMVAQLKHYMKMNNGRLPEKILYYRDGVSEGQFNQVLNIELKAMQNACRSVSAGYMPKITLLVVQKRHHTRFFPRRQDGDGSKNNNVLPGTVVDSLITHPTETDFYLVSHKSIQGTARPTKYHVLWDDNSYECAELEVLTYHLCYLFSRCNRSVSYPAPTYYAHLGAFRARTYWEGRSIDLNRLKEEQLVRGTIKERICTDSPMFFV